MDRRKRKHVENYNDMVARLLPDLHKRAEGDDTRIVTRTVTFQVTEDCNLACTYCLDGNTQIRMADYSLKEIKNIKIGDEVLGFDEYPEKSKQTLVKTSVVEELHQRTASVIKVNFECGESIKITPNHKILTRRNSYDNRYDYIEAGKLKVGQSVYHLPIADKNLALFDVEFDENYRIGYLVAMIKGDGSLKHYSRKCDGCNVFKFRIAVKDIEIVERCKQFLTSLNIPFYTKPFKISNKNNMWQEAIFANTRYTYNTLTKLIADNFMVNKSLSYYQGYLAGLYDAEGHICDDRTIRVCNTDINIIQEFMTGLDLIHIPYVLESDKKGTKNKPLKYNIRICDNSNAISSYRFIKSVHPSVPRKCFNKFLNYSPLKKTKIVSIEYINEVIPVYNIGTSTHTYIANGVAVHNCYQGHKTKKSMSFETAKKMVDMLLSSTPENNSYINPVISPGIIIEFIGGEPLLEIELIDKIADYFKSQARKIGHQWAEWFCISICSNGVLYFEPSVQKFLLKNRNNISFSITIDGDKELHDSCRVFHDGQPSYDIAVTGALDWMNRGYYMGSKITIAPENINFLYNAITHMIELGYEDIHANCVYEEGWTAAHATVLYTEMKRIADYLIDNDIEDKIYISLYEDNMFRPMDPEENQNWCWGKGTPILTTEGYKPVEEVVVGDYVYTEDGTIHPVINTLSHFADNVVNISVSGAFDLVCTDNHQLFSKPFDYLGWKGAKHYSEKTKLQVKDIQHKDLIKLFQLPAGTVEYRTELAYLVGRYIGDGWHYKDGGLRNKNGSDGYAICCSFGECEELEQYFSNANIEFCYSKNKTVAQYTIARRNCDNLNNIELLRILSNCGRLAHGKHLPPECFTWTKESLMSLLKGYMDADGTINKKNVQYRFNTVSYRLAQELMIILRTVGYTPTCYHNKRGGKGVIQGRDVSIRDRYEVYFYKDASKTCYIHESDDEMWTYGLKTTPAEPQMVYNITVDTNHSYIAGGIASSNCGGTCDMLCVDPDGNYSVCIRYLPSSLGDDQSPIYLGNVDRGLVTTDSEKACVKCMKCITRRSQSTDECFYCPIAHGCAWCFKAGTLITTPDGFKPIEDICVGDKVITGSGNIKEVEQLKKRYADDTVVIKATGTQPIFTTSEHPFLTRKFRRSGNNLIYGEPEWVSASEIKKPDKIALFVNEFGNESINENIAYLAGRYLGDGWYTESVRGNCCSSRYYICCSFEETEELERYFKLANVSYCKDKSTRTAQQYNVHLTDHEDSNNNEQLIAIISQCGKYAHGKRIPSTVFSWNRESAKAFLHGYFDADGFYDKNRKTVKFTTVSERLAQGISTLLLMFGQKSNWHIRKSNSNEIEGRVVNTHRVYELSFLLREPLRKYYEFDEENKIMWVNVKSVETGNDGYEVYNMSVADDHTFIANGAIVHNCSALNYQMNGTPDSRVTYICIMHKARALANVYFWNKYYRKHGDKERFKNNCPDDWALEIISQDELDMLDKLQEDD